MKYKLFFIPVMSVFLLSNASASNDYSFDLGDDYSGESLSLSNDSFFDFDVDRTKKSKQASPAEFVLWDGLQDEMELADDLLLTDNPLNQDINLFSSEEKQDEASNEEFSFGLIDWSGIDLDINLPFDTSDTDLMFSEKRMNVEDVISKLKKETYEKELKKREIADTLYFDLRETTPEEFLELKTRPIEGNDIDDNDINERTKKKLKKDL